MYVIKYKDATCIVRMMFQDVLMVAFVVDCKKDLCLSSSAFSHWGYSGVEKGNAKVSHY